MISRLEPLDIGPILYDKNIIGTAKYAVIFMCTFKVYFRTIKYGINFNNTPKKIFFVNYTLNVKKKLMV